MSTAFYIFSVSVPLLLSIFVTGLVTAYFVDNFKRGEKIWIPELIVSILGVASFWYGFVHSL